MKMLRIEVEDNSGAARHIEIACDPSEPLSALTQRLDEHGEIDTDGQAVIEIALGSAAVLDERRVLEQIAWPIAPIRLRRVCVEVHFESEEPARRNFPISAKWARVHRWACCKFDVAHDACAHLELHEGAPNGPVINERQEIGPSGSCKVVWVVKPGPEPNG
jgi:hypothetical protein